jgi:hypothetical protein
LSQFQSPRPFLTEHPNEMPRGRFQTIARLSNTLPPTPLEEPIPPVIPPLKQPRTWAGFRIFVQVRDYAIQSVTIGEGSFEGLLAVSDQAEMSVTAGDSVYEPVPVELEEAVTQRVTMGNGRSMPTRVLDDAATQSVTAGGGDLAPKIPLADAALQSETISGQNAGTLYLLERVLQGVEDGAGVYAVFLFVGDEASQQVGNPSGETEALLDIEERVLQDMADGPGDYPGQVEVSEAASQETTSGAGETVGLLALTDGAEQQASVSDGLYFDDTPVWEDGTPPSAPAHVSNYYWGLTDGQNPNVFLTPEQVSWHIEMFEVEKLIFKGDNPTAVFGVTIWFYQSGLAGGAYSALQKMPNLNPGDGTTNHNVLFSVGATLGAQYTL